MKRKKDFRYENIPSKFKEHKDEYLEIKAAYYEKCRQERLQNCVEVLFDNNCFNFWQTRKKLQEKSLAKYQSKESATNPVSYRV